MQAPFHYIIVLLGKSGSGKSTIESELATLGLNVAKTYTTRPRRSPDEQTHIFIDMQRVEELRRAGLVFAQTTFDDHVYLTTFAQYAANDVITWDPNGLLSALSNRYALAVRSRTHRGGTRCGRKAFIAS
jgi:guanylate kinase